MEEQSHSANENPEANSSESTVMESKENFISEVKSSETTLEVLNDVPQKEAIEILNVEVLPARKEPVKTNETKLLEDTMEIGNTEENSEAQTEQSQSSQEINTSEIKSVEDTNENDNVKESADERKQIETAIEPTEECNEMETDETENRNNKTQETAKQSSEATTAAKSSGLGLLAQYDSDNEDKNSDNDSVIEVPIAPGQDYRNQVVEIDSDSESDDSSDSSDVEYLNELRKTIEKRIDVADEEEDEDEEPNEDGGKKRPKQKLRVKGELLLEDLPPIHELKITVPEDECIEFGKVHSIVDQLVLVSALPNSILLDLETVIFLEKGQKVLGEVFDVLGQVADPLYCVRFNSNKQIKEKEINVGDIVYVAPKTQYTQYVILSNLMKLKGSDASWENDIEPPPRFLDYSDDEQEQLAKRQLRKKDMPADNDDPTKKPRTSGEEESASTSNRTNHGNNQYNRRSNNNRGGPQGYYNANSRPRYNGPQQQQQYHQPQRGPNHNRNSWHSNYYPQPYQHNHSSPANYGMPPVQPHTSQQYPPPPHVPMYGMPSNMPYPPNQPQQYGIPPMMQQPAPPPRLMPNSFSIRPPTLHGLPSHHSQQYTSPPPPPPGSQ